MTTHEERLEATRARISAILDMYAPSHRRFTHQVIRTFEDAALAQQEAGFEGTETKSMVMRSGDHYFIFMTTIGQRADIKAIRAHIGGPKPKFVTDEELSDHFGAEPGSAVPFGFDESIPIYVDPAVYDTEWILVCPGLPTETAQVQGEELRAIHAAIGDPVTEVTTFTLPTA